MPVALLDDGVELIVSFICVIKFLVFLIIIFFMF